MRVGAGMWCVLRTSGGRTLALAKSLADAGLEAWTPSTKQERRRPRSKASMEIDAPILPTFVFARASHLPDLLAAASSPVNPHPAFSVFRYCGKFPLIGDVEIAGLRGEEERGRVRRLRSTRRTFDRDASVRVPDGPFAGMSGVVRDCDGKYAMVSFNGGWQVKIATFLLEADTIEQTVTVPSANKERAA